MRIRRRGDSAALRSLSIQSTTSCVSLTAATVNSSQRATMAARATLSPPTAVAMEGAMLKRRDGHPTAPIHRVLSTAIEISMACTRLLHTEEAITGHNLRHSMARRAMRTVSHRLTELSTSTGNHRLTEFSKPEVSTLPSQLRSTTAIKNQPRSAMVTNSSQTRFRP